MEKQKNSLYDKQTSVSFYEDRHAHGYMDGYWPLQKKQQILDVLTDLQLPQNGEVLDFGCGNGELTEVISKALPKWNVYGTDISRNALEKAKEKYPEHTFFSADSDEFAGKKFDLLFTNHVLEHVYNLPQIIEEMNHYLKPGAFMLHCLPCGNEGSFEYNVCLLRKGGINPELENRFFFEDVGHVRRLTTDQLSKLWAEKGLVLIKGYYGNQYYGSIEWITRSGPDFVRMFTDTAQSVNEQAKRSLKVLKYKLLVIAVLRSFAIGLKHRLNRPNKNIKNYIYILGALPLYVFSKPMDLYCEHKSLEEWHKRKMEQNGSEMYLIFKDRLRPTPSL
jgi:ubiquinone/menaquinone biosynthesis C-methylase UbiE